MAYIYTDGTLPLHGQNEIQDMEISGYFKDIFQLSLWKLVDIFKDIFQISLWKLVASQ